jgi:hypothetical protein
MPPGLRRARKGNHPDTGIGENSGADLGRRTGNNAKQAWRKPRLVKDLCDLEAGDRGQLRGLQDEAIASRQRQDHLFMARRNGALNGAMPAITPSG